ncbi:hypothetical protein EU524_01055 [Candidatus Thorarchaeota archaeon]|nr:MAG: hypothetical protein EU524_01055 [Candidatus Thorarchaeota archaeon]
MTLEKTTRTRRIFKVLILGLDPRRRNGLLGEAAGENVSCQLHSSIGVSLGVSQTVLSDGSEVALQLWSLPTEERYASLVKSFVRGHRAIIVVLEPGNETHLNEILRNVPKKSLDRSMFILLGSRDETDSTRASVEKLVRDHTRYRRSTVDDLINKLAEAIVAPVGVGMPIVARLPSSACPLLEPESRSKDPAPNTKEEIEEIRVVAHGLGLKTEGDNCLIPLEEGQVNVSLRTGLVEMQPLICQHCKLPCRRRTKICIIGQDSGWSSRSLGKKAILTMAKIVGLAQRDVPQHVEMQIFRSCVCNRFSPAEGTPESVLEEIISAGSMRRNRETLLELADRRVREGRLPEAVFNILKRRLDKLTSTGM